MHELKVVRERRVGYGKARSIKGSVDVYQVFKERMEQTDREEFLVLLLNGKSKMIGFNTVSIGTVTASLVHPREVFKPAILGNAVQIILVHNHPSGDPIPSAEDIEITKRLRATGEVMGIKVMDHIIIGCGQYISFVDDGYW
jgi:DNA repair protein RadC